jgi:hypothetical protein
MTVICNQCNEKRAHRDATIYDDYAICTFCMSMKHQTQSPVKYVIAIFEHNCLSSKQLKYLNKEAKLMIQL